MAGYTFLITGASSGLGLAIAISALEAGHAVLAGARNPTIATTDNPRIKELGGEWIQLDVTDPSTERKVKRLAEEKNIDVLVNNAGYSLIGAVEDMSDEEIHAQMDTNLYGVLRCTKGVLPVFRARNWGTIVNVSSIAGLDGLPSCGLYAASKFAVEGLSESLARELAPFSIRVLLVEPGAFKTNFLNSFPEPAKGMTEAYRNGPCGETAEKLKKMAGSQIGDPREGAARIVEVITGKDMGADADVKACLRVILGRDCWERAMAKTKVLTKNLEVMERIAKSTAFQN